MEEIAEFRPSLILFLLLLPPFVDTPRGTVLDGIWTLELPTLRTLLDGGTSVVLSDVAIEDNGISSSEIFEASLFFRPGPA